VTNQPADLEEAFRAAANAMAACPTAHDDDPFIWHRCDACPTKGRCGCSGRPWPSPTVQAGIRAVWDLAVGHGRALHARDIIHCPACGQKVLHGHIGSPRDQHPKTWACVNSECARYAPLLAGGA
jgi:hypothetical protein